MEAQGTLDLGPIRKQQDLLTLRPSDILVIKIIFVIVIVSFLIIILVII